MAKQKLVPLFDKGERIAGMFFDKKTDIVYFLKSIGAKKYKFTTGVKRDQIPSAKRVANLKLRKALGTDKTFVRPLIKDEVPKWIEAKESDDLDPATMIKVRDAVKRIEPFWGSMLTSEITRDNIAAWTKWLEQEFPGQQKENAFKYLRNFAKYLSAKQHNGASLLPAMPNISDPDRKKTKAERKKRKGRIFTAEEFKDIYRAGSPIERALAIIMYTMATRVHETLSLKRGEQVIETDDGLVYQWSHGQNKADLDGEHFFHSKAAKAINAIYRDDTDFLFPQRNLKQPLKAQQIEWSDWRTRAGLDWHWTSHTFRHTCLSNLFNDEKNPQALICKLYRVSLAVALDVYVKPTKLGILRMRDSLKVIV